MKGQGGRPPVEQEKVRFEDLVVYLTRKFEIVKNLIRVC